MVVALCLGSLQRSQYLHNQAALYHLEALKSGYLAVRVQRPQDAFWEQGWRKTWTWPSPLALDRTTVSKAWPLWQQSIENARKSQICFDASRMPWRFWTSSSAEFALQPPHPMTMTCSHGGIRRSRPTSGCLALITPTGMATATARTWICSAFCKTGQIKPFDEDLLGVRSVRSCL